MTGLILAALVALVIFFVMKKMLDMEQEAREREFEAKMRALEEKAKKEGTFKVSFFDVDKQE
jgi:heme exporter protein D